MPAVRVIQAFPPGMALPPPDGAPDLERWAPAERPEQPRHERDERAALVLRRKAMIDELARLSSHSHRRVALLARLAEATRQLLALEQRR